MTEKKTLFLFPGPHRPEKSAFCSSIGYRKLYCQKCHVFFIILTPKTGKKTGPNRIREVRFDKMYHAWSPLNIFCFKTLLVKLISGAARWACTTPDSQRSIPDKFCLEIFSHIEIPVVPIGV